jgi:hypothetical protein
MDSLICHECGGELRRSRRSLLERFGYSKAYRCKQCQLRVRISHAEDSRGLQFASCPKCRSFELTAPRRVDKIDRMLKSPRSLLQRMLGGRLYHCWFCRLQFYDVRPRKKQRKLLMAG